MSLESFMIKNEAQEIDYVASKRFVDQATGKPEVWKLKSITADENDTIRKQCYKQIQNGKKITREFNTVKYLEMLVDKCVIYPDLHDVKLQDFFGEMDAIVMLKRHMLTPGEYDDLTQKVQEINGYNLDEEIEEAKN